MWVLGLDVCSKCVVCMGIVFAVAFGISNVRRSMLKSVKAIGYCSIELRSSV